MNIFITGITGFVGSHLADYIVENYPQNQVYGLVRWRSPLDNISHLIRENKITLLQGDLLDLPSIERAFQACRPGIVFHLAAQSYVPYSYEAPISTLQTNVIGSANLFSAAGEMAGVPTIHVCSCYDEETKVLTQRGFLGYEEINESDSVVAIDPITEDVRYFPISKVFIYNYSGKMRHLQTRSIDLLVTPNHMILSKKKRNRELKFERADSILPTARRFLPEGKHVGKKEDSFVIGNKCYDIKDVFYLLGLYIGDGYSGTQVKEIELKSGLRRSEYLRRCRGGDGQFISKTFKEGVVGTCASHRNFLAIPEGDKARWKAIECLDRMGISHSCYKNSIYFTSKAFVDFFDQVTHSALTKKIPKWAFEYDYEILDYLYEGLIDSDGSYHVAGERFSTSSPDLATDFFQLCLYTGRFATMSPREGRHPKIDERIITAKTNYLFSISFGSKLFRGKNITIEDYSGYVWCLEVPNASNFAVRRNGKIAFCGNSSEVYGQPEYTPIDEEHPLNPVSPYGVSKAAMDMLAYSEFIAHDLPTIRTRAFTHSGPRRGNIFVASTFAKQIAEVEAGLRDIVYVGNLDSIRTFCDVRDMVHAYWMAIQYCILGEVYNVGGNETISIGEMLDILKCLSTAKIIAKIDPALLRPADVTLQIPDISKFQKATGWAPIIPLDQTLKDLLDYHRERING